MRCYQGYGKRIREQGLIPIIALTANAMTGMREMFLEKGFNDFLTKPIDISKLDETLHQWIPKKKRIENKKQKKKLVLLVDNNSANLRLGKNVLRVEYNVATVPSIEKMFLFLEYNKPAVILMNNNMNGSHPIPKEIPVVLLTEPYDTSSLISLTKSCFAAGIHIVENCQD